MAELRRLAKLKAPLVRVRGKWMELRPGEVERLVEFLASGRRSSGTRHERGGGARRRGRRRAPGCRRPRDRRGGRRPARSAAARRAGAGPRGPPDARGVLGRAPPLPAARRRVARPARARRPRRLPRGRHGARQDGDGAGADAGRAVGARGAAAGARAQRRAPTSRASATAPATSPATAGSRPTLVVCPTSVVGNWQREAERFTPALRVHVHHGATRGRAGALAAQVAGADVVITSYSLVDRDRTALAGIRVGPGGPRRGAEHEEPRGQAGQGGTRPRPPGRIALTGTPVENHLGELWSIMEFLNPGSSAPARRSARTSPCPSRLPGRGRRGAPAHA